MERAGDGLLDRIKRCVYDKSDLHFSAKKTAYFERRVKERMEKVGAGGYEAYYACLVANPQEVHSLVELLTTNQTYFFRNAGQFGALSDSVIPALVEAKGREAARGWPGGQAAGQGCHPAMSIRVWSAGCSTGEEAYSIAFTLLDAVKYPRAWELDVLATDINRDVLDAARRGVYQDDTLRQVEPSLKTRYMVRSADGWSIGDDARRITGFYTANIKDVTAGGDRTIGLGGPDGLTLTLDVRERFDIIFCRNVMIYFDRAGQQRLVDALYDCLRPGGYLFTGDSEPLHLFTHGFVRAEDDGALYYRKPE